MKWFLPVLILVGSYTFATKLVATESESILSRLALIEDSSQQSIDELEKLLVASESLDSPEVKMQVLSEYAKRLNSAGQLELALEMSTKLYQEATSVDNTRWQVESLVIQAQIARSRSQYDQASKILIEQVIPLAEKNNLKSIADHYRLLGVYQRNLGKLNDAKLSYQKALKLYQSQEDELGVGRTHSGLGVLFETKGEMNDALEHHLKARVIFERFDDIDELATNYYNLGEMYRRSGDPDKALELFKRALEMDIRRNNLSDMGYSYTKVASMLEFYKNYEEALVYSQKSIDTFSRLKDDRMLSWALPLYARLNKQLGNFNGYHQALKLSKETAIRSGSKVQQRGIHQTLALYYLNQDDLELARKEIELSLAAMQGLDIDVITHDVYSVYGKVLAAQGELESAYYQIRAAYDLYQEFNENTHADAVERYKKDVNLLEEKLKVKGLEQESRLQQEQFEREKLQRNTIFTGIAFIVILLLMFAYLQYHRRRTAVYKSNLVIESLDKKNAYLAEVAHDLRHPLSVLSNHLEALEDGIVDPSEKAFKTLHDRITQLNRLVGDLRSASLAEIGALSLHQQDVPIKSFIIQQIEHYKPLVSKASLQLDTDFQIDETLSVSIDKDRFAQVLGNLLKNSIRYTSSKGSILVSLTVEAEQLVIEVSDSAPSIPEEEFDKIFEFLYRSDMTKSMSTKGSGLGLSISKSIVDAHGGEIAARASGLGGLAVTIRLPL